MQEPDRWLHLRHPEGFSEARFREFVAHCAVFEAHAQALLAHWPVLTLVGGAHTPTYIFFPPTLSEDRRIASLPLGGERTVGSRSAIEDGLSFLLWAYFPIDFQSQLDEGVTETIDRARGPRTSWRTPDEVGGLRVMFNRRQAKSPEQS